MHPRPHRPEEGCGQGPLGDRRAQAARADRSRRDLGLLDHHGSGAGRGVRVARRRARPRRLLPFRELRAAARGGAAGPRRAGAPRWRRGRAGAGGRGRRDDRPGRTLDRARAGDAVRPAQDRGGLGRLPRAPRGPARPGAVAGVSLVNALRVEPELGTPARGGLPAAVATRTAAGGWRLTGHKIFATGAPSSPGRGSGPAPTSPCRGWARSSSRPAGRGRASSRPGTTSACGRAAATTSCSRASRCPRTTRSTCAGRSGGADPRPGPGTRCSIAALYLGVAHAARDWLVRLPAGAGAGNLGKPLATLPRFQAAVGEIEAASPPARGWSRAPAARSTTGRIVPAARARAWSSSPARAPRSPPWRRRSTLIGNHGLSRRNPLERHLRDVLCGRIHTPQDDSVLLAAGKAALGLA